MKKSNSILFIVLFVAVVAICFAGLFTVLGMGDEAKIDSVDDLYVVYGEREILGRVHSSLHDAVVQIFLLISTQDKGSSGEFDEITVQNEENKEIINALLSEIKEDYPDNVELAASAQKALDLYITYEDIFADVAALVAMGDFESAATEALTMEEQNTILSDELYTLEAELAQVASQIRDEAKAASERFDVSNTVMFTLSGVAVLFFAYLTVSSVAKLQKSERSFRKRNQLFTENTKECHAFYDSKSNKITYYTGNAESFFGAKIKDMNSPEKFAEGISNSDREDFMNSLTRAVQGAPSHVFYSYKRTQIGPSSHFATEMYPIKGESSRQDGVLLVSVDATHDYLLTEQGRTLSQLVENSNNMICVFKNMQQMEYVNEQALQFRGIENPEDALEMGFAAFFDSDDAVAKEIPDEIKRPEPMSVMRRVALRRFDGELIDIEQTIFTFKDVKGANKYAVIGREITDMVENEYELNKLKSDFDSMKVVKSEVIASQERRLSAPLKAIEDTLVSMQHSEDSDANITAALKSVDELSFTLANVLDTARAQTNGLKIKSEEFTLEDKLQSIIDMFSERFSERDISFDVRIKHMSETFVGDGEKIARVVRNLLENALKYTTVGNVSLSQDFFAEKTGAVVLGFTIADSGIGMSENEIESVFARSLGDDKTKLGLYVSKRIAKSMLGDITVTSVEGSGSVFTFTAEVKTSD